VLSSDVHEKDCVELCVGKKRKEYVMKYLLWKLAAVDPKTMQESSASDQIFASMMGMLVLASGVVIFLASYDAFMYLTPEGFGGWLLSVVLSLIVTAIMVLFNVLMLHHSWIKKKDSASKKLSVRTFVSLLFNASLGILLLFSVFGDTIKMQQEKFYREDNKMFIEKRDRDIRDNFERTVQPLVQKMEALQRKHQQLLESHAKETQTPQVLQKRLEALRGRLALLEKDINVTQARMKEEQQILRNAKANFERYSQLYQCESNGWGKVVINGKEELCSTKEGEGERTEDYTQNKRMAESEIKTSRTSLQKLNQQLQTLQSQYRDTMNKKDEVGLKIEALKQQERELKDIERQLQETNQQLQNAQKRHQAFKKEADEAMRNDPEFREKRDDVLTMFRALFALFADEKDGPGVAAVALIILVMMVLLEMIPVVAKTMLFDPKRSEYAALQQEYMDIVQKRQQLFGET